MSVTNNPDFYCIGATCCESGWVYDLWAIFRFLELPPEIRNKIYDLVVPSCRVLIVGSHPQRDIAKYKDIHRCLRAPKHRYRLNSVLLSDTDPRDLAVAVAFLKICRVFNHEITSMLYAKTTFRFTTIKHINKFLSIIPAQGKKDIMNIEISYSAYGEPQWTKDEYWKRKSDWKWSLVCTRLRQELPALKDVSVDVRIADWPIQLKSSAKCFIPLDVLKGPGLERARVNLSHYRFHPNRCNSVARALEDIMMTPEGRELRDIEEAVAAVQQMQLEGTRQAQLPPLRAKRVLVIKDAIPKAVEARPQILQKQIAPNKSIAKSKPVYRTKGLEGWSRVSLDKVGVTWCGPPQLSGGINNIVTL